MEKLIKALERRMYKAVKVPASTYEHSDKPGEGAKKRRKLKGKGAKKKKFAAVMHEWKHGKLHSGKSKKTLGEEDYDQAVAIAMHESGQAKKKSK
jgi:hypothetical protein